jgi:hypothetical protein
MNDKESALALCPYYQRWDGKQRIQCESCLKRTRLIFTFRSRAEAEKHKRRYCDQYDWTMCEYARQMNERIE